VNILCRVFGHGCKTIQSKEIASFLALDNWTWPGVITFCPRCGMVYKHTGVNDADIKPPWFAGQTMPPRGQISHP